MAYEHVNAAWPETLPALTGQEAMSAAKRLYRFAMKRPFRGKMKLTSGRRYTWIRCGVFHVNPEGQHFGGWKDLVHCISHYCTHRLHPKAKSHGPQHAWIERTMIEHVVNSGWLDGKLKRQEKTKQDPKTTRHQNVLTRLARWEAKKRRAETALRKLRRQQAYYERQEAPA